MGRNQRRDGSRAALGEKKEVIVCRGAGWEWIFVELGEDGCRERMQLLAGIRGY
jgi:hypothetical protein